MSPGFVFPLAVAILQAAGPNPRATDGSPESVPVRIDVTHSTLSFSVRHFGVTKIRGIFNEWSATILWNEADLTKSSVAVVVKTASVDTRHRRRDGDLTGENFFDSERYPAIVLRSKRIERDGEAYVLYGDLTVRDVTKQVAIPFEFLGVQEIRGTRIFAAGSFDIKRSDFGLARENRLARALGVVSDKVEFELDIQGVLADPSGARFNSRNRPSIGEVMASTVDSDGVAAALEQYRTLKASQPDGYNFTEREPLVLAYRLRAAGQLDAALEIADFMMEQAASPDWHVFLARVGAAQGEADGAADQLQQALELDPYNTLAMVLLQELAAAHP